MKHISFLLFVLFISFSCTYAQVSIGTSKKEVITILENAKVKFTTDSIGNIQYVHHTGKATCVMKNDTVSYVSLTYNNKLLNKTVESYNNTYTVLHELYWKDYLSGLTYFIESITESEFTLQIRR